MKNKLDDFTKAKLIYCGELLLFSIVFLVLGILKLTNIIGYDPNKQNIFNWITIFGGSWVVIDFIWMLISKKRRAKNCLLDKALNLPLGIFVIVFDIICFTNAQNEMLPTFYRFGVGSMFLYMALNLGFQSIYHYFNPLQAIYEAVEEDKLKEEKELNQSKEQSIGDNTENINKETKD